mmetsp:Transcript_62234/g.147425  ORF Transcript_62234/g.147425 Transcript_62234/m.147425 type:complete len:209 (+) Transcript_62234:582-1208(+)
MRLSMCNASCWSTGGMSRRARATPKLREVASDASGRRAELEGPTVGKDRPRAGALLRLLRKQRNSGSGSFSRGWLRRRRRTRMCLVPRSGPSSACRRTRSNATPLNTKRIARRRAKPLAEIAGSLPPVARPRHTSVRSPPSTAKSLSSRPSTSKPKTATWTSNPSLRPSSPSCRRSRTSRSASAPKSPSSRSWRPPRTPRTWRSSCCS